MESTLKKITNKAKQLRLKNKNLKWTDAVKKASLELRKSGKIKSQTGFSNKKIDRKRKALPPGKRVSERGKTYYERRVNRSDMPGTLTGVSEEKLIGAVKEKIWGIMGKAYIDYNKAISKKEKSNFGKIIVECKRKLKKLS